MRCLILLKLLLKETSALVRTTNQSDLRKEKGRALLYFDFRYLQNQNHSWHVDSIADSDSTRKYIKIKLLAALFKK